VASHIRTYLESGGAKGHPSVVRTRCCSRPAAANQAGSAGPPLYYGRDGGAYLVVASNGGSSKHPLWYLNLREHPLVEVQVGSEIFEATARPATAAERSHLWQVMAAVFPPYDGMQQKTKREIPVVVIEPVGSEHEAHVLRTSTERR
jgi:deazaflavin-dependent oxidoreductase (nitroreductase family)